ncbi:MAG TPA: biosynthetic-type acetolactate synthase large subunit [Fluviicola sp.]|nr:biosynthetic-type acetolactate synthase large subunit [Fluviicola sp.]
METQRITGAEAVMKCLRFENISTIFGYPGGAIMPIYDALYDYRETIRHILVRHEQGAVHAAQGFARAGGHTGVVLATSGPGATNLITGLADALIDSTPIVCITGQVASHLLGTDAFQETDVIGISMPVTKWNIQVTRAEDIAPALAKAFYIASSGRPGPVLVDITKDAQFGLTDFHYQPCTEIRSYRPVPIPDRDLLSEAAGLINSAQKPYLLIGQGILLSHAEEQLLRFAEKTGIPVASTLLGLGAFPADHPLYVGYLGMHGNYAPNLLTNECDVLIAIGMRFDDRVTGDVARYARQAKVIHIDIDASELNKIIPAAVAVHADAGHALEILFDLVGENQHGRWLQQFRDLEAVERKEIIEPAVFPDNEKLNMARVVHELSTWNKRSNDLIVVTDVGQHQMITSRYFSYRQARTNITSGGLGTMGFALPAAIGAGLARPDKTVVAIIGDGGFQMTIQELGTILQHGLSVKIIVLNNHFLGMVRQWQQLFFDRRYSFTEIVNPDFVTIVSGYRIPAQQVETGEAFSPALECLLRTKGSAFLECVVEREENVFPMVETGASVAEIRLN